MPLYLSLSPSVIAREFKYVLSFMSLSGLATYVASGWHGLTLVLAISSCHHRIYLAIAADA